MIYGESELLLLHFSNLFVVICLKMLQIGKNLNLYLKTLEVNKHICQMGC